MTEEARKYANALRMIADCDGNRCSKCEQVELFDVLACSMQWKVLYSSADLIESLSYLLEQSENKLSELLYYTTGGRFSKTDYSTDDMRRFVDDYSQSVCEECEKSAQLDQVTRERDAAIRDLIAHGTCDVCGYEPQEDVCIRCRSYTERPYWKWRGVEVEDVHA